MSTDDSSDPSRPVVYYTSGTDPIRFAGRELGRYLSRVLGVTVPVEQRTAGGDIQIDGFWVGPSDDFLGVEAPSVQNRSFDDGIVVETDGETGVISGTNPRSVLLAVYRYLGEIGCRWIRPGPDGEILPERDTLPPVTLSETPSYRHRGICTEGVVSVDHVRDMIDFIPKLGFNSYFPQLFEAYPFFERWYEAHDNPYREGESFTEAQAVEYYDECIRALEKRGLIRHAVGHGWTNRVLDAPAKGWDVWEGGVPEHRREHAAKFGGERDLYGREDGVPLKTELCYSNAETRQLLIDAVCSYAEENPGVDYLHVWQSDGHNNHCECGTCRDSLPSDLYATTLNELDAAMRERGLDTRVVFVVYTDLLWPPRETRIENPDRFALMYAPIARPYADSYGTVTELPERESYDRNEMIPPSTVAGNVAYLDGWLEQFDGEAFAYEYHLMRNQYHDPPGMEIARVLADDVTHLADIGLSGLQMCCTQRTFFPTGVGMYVLGQLLWDHDRSFEDATEEYFAAAFGEAGNDAMEFLERLSKQFNQEFLHGEEPDESTDVAADFAQVSASIDAFQPVIATQCERTTGSRARSWDILDHFAEIGSQLASAFEALAQGDERTAARRWNRAEEIVWRNEPEFHRVLDSYWFTRRLGENFEEQEEIGQL